MLISSVNLVNNYKFSDYILDKIKEEQSAQDEEAKRKYKRNSLCGPIPPKVRPITLTLNKNKTRLYGE